MRGPATRAFFEQRRRSRWSRAAAEVVAGGEDALVVGPSCSQHLRAVVVLAPHTLHGPAEGAGERLPLRVLQLLELRDVGAVGGVAEQQLVRAAVALHELGIGAEVEVCDERVVLLEDALHHVRVCLRSCLHVVLRHSVATS